MVARGAVYWASLDKRRPCVVLSSNDVLGVDIWQAHVVPLTSNLERTGLAGNVLLTSSATGLPTDSVAVPLGLELVDRSWLTERVGQLPAALVGAIDDGIRAVLGYKRETSAVRGGLRRLGFCGGRSGRRESRCRRRVLG
ncbi:type II toxin-antitoxin system PemK/MazF family toxin [Candidatus Poriferisocius sp.]|uniref:type II toxin-antitoxin system PemK/MazF family toxin n=1 Tax=Candidatus Poriferisocius sp. TaxID=3101276 RepID=UPI003B594A2E